MKQDRDEKKNRAEKHYNSQNTLNRSFSDKKNQLSNKNLRKQAFTCICVLIYICVCEFMYSD